MPKIESQGVKDRLRAALKQQRQGGFNESQPLMPYQQIVWEDLQSDPDGAPLRTIVEIIEIHGAVDPALLSQALQHVVSRTTALRLRFIVSSRGKVIQAVQGSLSAEVALVDLSASLHPVSAVAEWISSARRSNVHSQESTPWRHCLLKASATHFYWFTQYSPLIVSESAAKLANQRIASTFSALTRGESVDLPDDRAAWLSMVSLARDYQYSPAFVTDREYWAQTRARTTAVSLSLRTTRSVGREPVSGRASLPRERVAKLANRSAASQIALDRLLVACAAAHVHRATATHELTLGVIVSPTVQPETSTCSAAAADVLPVALSLRADDTVCLLARQTDQRIREAFGHRQFGMVGFRSLEGINVNSTSLCRVIVDVAGVPAATQTVIAGFRTMLDSPPSHVEDLSIRIRMSDDGMEIRVAGNPRNYETWEVESHARQLRDLLEALAEETHADPAIHALPCMSAEESHRILVSFNQTQRSFDALTPIYRLFERMVEQSPDSTALLCNDQILSYAELNRRSNQLASFLRARGVGPDERVAICAERSPEMLVAVLGALKAGGTYVPVDPAYPSERIGFMLAECAPRVICTQGRRATQHGIAGAVALDLEWDELARCADGDLDPESLNLMPANIAYVIYTSGSTGRPKGASVPHLGLINMLKWYTDYLAFDAQDSALIVSSFSFDLTQKNLLAPLITGGRIHLAQEPFDPGAITKQIEREQVTALTLTPSALYSIIDAAQTGTLASLRKVLLGGEPLSWSRIEKFVREYPQVEIVNSYGPTECTDIVSFHSVTSPANDADGLVIPLGRPIPNTQLYIVDRALRPVPVGVVGEICIAGANVSRGYLNGQQLSATRFLPNPFGESAGGRVYRTGDLGRFLPDGNIEFFGRLDRQVKFNGFRIELGEIEDALLKAEHVKGVVVLMRDLGQSGDQLVAYVVADSTGAWSEDTEQLRLHCQQRLPAHMVPQLFMPVEAFPLTPNGKVDRDALRALDPSRRGEYVPPEGMTELLLATLWCRVLKIERVGRRDNFFALGGHSLMTAQLMTRVRDAFRVELPIRVFFDEQTIEAQAQAIDRAQKVSVDALAPLLAVSRQEPLPLSYAQQRLWFLGQYTGPSALYNIPYSTYLPPDLDIAVLIRSLQTIVARHEALRTRYEAGADGPVQVIDQSILQLEVESVATEADLQRICDAERFYQFDLSRDRLCRIRLLRDDVNGGKYVLLMTTHHSVFDGWSLAIVMRELDTLYQAYVRDEPSPLPPLSIQYADYAHWQRRFLTGAALQRHAEYWRAQLEGLPPLLTLPTDRPRPVQQTFRGSWEPIDFTPELSERLAKFSQQQNVTLFMTLLAGYAALLSRYSGQDDIAIGTVTANRNMQETEAVVGFFVNALVMRTDFRKDPTVRQLLRQTRETALQAYAYQDMPFEHIVEQMNPERSLSHSPLFQAIFTMQNLNDRVIRPEAGHASEQRVTSFANEGGTISRFDVSLFLQESPGGITGGLEYNADLFDRSTIQRFVKHLECLFEAMSQTPEERVSRLDVLTPQERSQQLLDWNGRTVPLERDECAHELIESQVGRCADRVAARQHGAELTYAELNEQANQLAHYLIAQGVRPGTLVGICIDRSLDMLVGILGILKAGGAYVPLDPGYPAQRLSYLLRDAGLRLVLTSTNLLSDLPLGDQKVFPLDAELRDSLLANYSHENIAKGRLGLTAQDLAYVIYTSGSTGEPKGVPIRHASLCNYLDHAGREYLSESITAAVVSLPLSFDATVTTLLAPLCAGKRVDLLPEGPQLISILCERLFAADRPQLFKITPAHLQAMVNLSAGRKSSQPHMIVIGGEQLTPAALLPWHTDLLPAATYINEYGPTETVVGCSTYSVGPARPTGDYGSLSGIPIGRAIQNTSLYVLGKADQLLPVNCVGELCIGGAGLSPGYLNQPELTQRKFVECQLDQGVPVRIYRSGDLARWLPHGELEYVGRLDNQLKIRGYRIEAGEVEATLCSHAGVARALVLKHEEHLVGYLIPTPAQDAALRAWQRVKEQEQWLTVTKRELANGMMFGCRDPLELDTSYEEIFRERIYLRHGIRLRHGACIFDVGVNIGMFGVFASSISTGVRIHAFEPTAAAGPALEFNASLHGLNLMVHGGSLDAVIEEERIDSIDLLRIDVPHSELAILSGLEAAHWNKIRQIVLKVHDGGVGLAAVTALLEKQSFVCQTEHRESRDGNSIAYVYAIASAYREVAGEDAAQDAVISQIWHDSRSFLNDVQRQVRSQLPHYMVPNRFVILDEVPLSENGKIDVRALPLPDMTGADTRSGPPEGAIETELARLWVEVLKVERVGRLDSFFDLGGHSLLATQLISRIRETFAIELPIRLIFDQQTLWSQAQAIEQQQQQEADEYVPISPISRDMPLRPSFAQQRLWFISQYMGPTTIYNVPHGMQLRGVIHVDALLASLEEIVARHEVLRTRFEVRNGECEQVIDPPALSLRLETPGSRAQLQELCRAEWQRPFDLSKDRLCRIRLLQVTGEDAYVLLVTMHHVVSDEWSTGILFRELQTLYHAFSEGCSSPLEPLPIQYADYAHWQREWLSGKTLERHLEYWSNQLEDLPPRLMLRTDRPRPAQQTFNGNRISLALPGILAERLRTLSQEQGVTLFMTMLSAFAALLSHHAGQKDVAIGSPIANRTRRETEALIGFFVNTLVLRVDLSEDPSVVDLLQQARETALQAYAHQEIPFERLVEALNPERNPAHSPLFQVLFALQNVPMEQVTASGLTFEPLVLDAPNGHAHGGGVARFDLSLIAAQGTDGIHGQLEYNTDLFDRGTIERFCEHYRWVLESMVAEPRQRVSQLDCWKRIAVPAGRVELPDGRARRTALAKLEAVLSSFEGVKEVAVADRPRADGERSCTVYLVPASPESGREWASDRLLKQLRDHVRAQSGRHVMPDCVVVLESLPRAVDGRVSRRDLPDPARLDAREYEAPEGPIEEMLAALWRDLLGVKRVGREDGFFALGGHSLVASQLISRIRIAFAVELPLRTLFDAQTLRAQAAAIAQAQRAAQDEAETAAGLRDRFQQNRQSLDDYDGRLDEGEI